MMWASIPFTGARALRDVQERWPGTPFTLRGTSQQDVLHWWDGPTRDQVRHVVAPDTTYSHKNPVGYHRRTSCLAWTLIRSPQLHKSQHVPPSTPEEIDALWEQRDHRAFRDTIAGGLNLLDATDLSDPLQVAGSALQLARAETAAVLGKTLSEESMDSFELWLTHGGWDLACTLNP